MPVVESMAVMYAISAGVSGLGSLVSSISNAWSSHKNRQSSERINALSRDSSEEIARLSRKHSAELQYNQLKFSILQQRENQDFQKELAELSHERLKEIEVFRAQVNFAINQNNLDFQKWSFEQKKKIEFEILQLQQDFQRDLSQIQHQNALIQMRERMRADQSPINNLACDLLENSFSHSIMPLKVFLAPPILDYDHSTGKPYNDGYEGFLAKEIEQFLHQGYLNSKERPVQLVDDSWVSKKQGGGSALQSIHAQLKSIPVLILESKIPAGELNLGLGYWNSGDTSYTQSSILSGIVFSDLLRSSVKHRALEWEVTRRKLEALGEDKVYIKNFGGVNEENLQTYYKELAEKTKLEPHGIDTSNLPVSKEYKITEADYKSFYQYLVVWHCLVIGLYADMLFLGDSWENTPLLPSLIPYLIEKYKNHFLLTPQFWQEAIAKIVTAYGQFYDGLKSEAANCSPEVRMKLALSLANLPSKYQYLALEQGNKAFSDWLEANGVPFNKILDVNNNYDDYQTLKRIICQEDKPFLESLKLLLEKVRDAEKIEASQTERIDSLLFGCQFLSRVGNIPQSSAIAIRFYFCDQLKQMYKTLVESEKQAVEASGTLGLSALIDSLDREVDKLKNAKFRFLIIGDFNRGKSSILNVLLGQEVLRMGVTATTSIPTFVRYGEQEKVIVYKKDGTQDSMSLRDYKEKYTLNSKQVKDTIKNIFKTGTGNWLIPLEKAEIYYPVELLSRGVEFIDTAGLGHSEEGNRKTFSYIPECHAILFVLTANQLLSNEEKDYLNIHIKNKVGTVFFLINKWDCIEESEKKEVHDVFVKKLSKCLTVEENDVEKMWGNTIFDVSAKKALEKLREGKSLDGTGFIQFKTRLDQFLIHERLTTVLLSSVQIATSVMNTVTKIVEERLLVLGVNSQAEAKRLEALKSDISAQWETINAKYTEIATAKKSVIL
jgi:GTP-binding protein EngB required for normal cell division